MVDTANKGYFRRVLEQASTDLWVNNPMPEQAKRAIEVGAVSVSTNPTYPSKLAGDYFPKRLSC